MSWSISFKCDDWDSEGHEFRVACEDDTFSGCLLMALRSSQDMALGGVLELLASVIDEGDFYTGDGPYKKVRERFVSAARDAILSIDRLRREALERESDLGEADPQQVQA